MELFKVFGTVALRTGGAIQSLNEVTRVARRTSQKIGQIGQGMKTFGSGMTKAVTLPLVAMGGLSLKAAADFEAGMSEVKAISGATGRQLEDLKNKAKEMGRTTKFSATQSSEALKYMAMAGWKTEQMMEGLPGVMNLAAASGEELGIVSDIVTDALTAFNMEAKDAGKFADLLANAASNANTNVSMLGEAFTYAAPVAAAMNYSVEDVTMALSLMANAGIKASMAGTSLRAGMVRMAAPPKKAAEALDDLNINLKDSDGNMFSLAKTIEILRGKFKGMSTSQQAANADAIFGKTAMAGWLSIINASEKDLTKLTKATHEYDGAAKKMADTMQDNLKGQLTLLKSQLEGIGIEIGEILTPYIRKLTGFVSKAAGAFSGLNTNTKKVLIVLGLLFAAIGPLIFAAGTLAAAIGAIGTVLTAIGLPIIATVGALGLLATAFGAIALGTIIAQYGGLKNTMSALNYFIRKTFVPSLQFLATGKGLGKVEDSTGKLWKVLYKLRRKMEDVSHFIRNSFVPALKYLATGEGLEKVEDKTGALKEALKRLRAQIEDVKDFIEESFVPALKYLATGEGLGKVKGATDETKEGLMGLREIVEDFIKDVNDFNLGTMIKEFANLINTISDAVDGFKSLWNNKAFKFFVREGGVGGKIGKAVGGFLSDEKKKEKKKKEKIPKMATGGVLSSPGRVIVGEKGKELLDLPEGARVTPLTGRDARTHSIIIDKGAFDGAFIFDDYGVDKLIDRITGRLRQVQINPK